MKTNAHSLTFAMFLAAAVNCLAQPSISLQPANQAVNQGFNATFRAAGIGAPPLSYQWFFASNLIAGAITNVLTITNARPENAGAYLVVFSDVSGSSTSRVATLTVLLPALLDPKLSANIRLSEDPPALPSGRRAQTETHLARSWNDPNLLIATCMEGSMTDAALDCSYSVSTDGGATWSARAFIPNLTALSGGTALRAADVVTAVDASGSLFATTLSVNSAGNRSIDLFISKSSDRGQSFGPPRSLYQANARYWADKEWIAINTFPDSPTFNRIAVAFSRLDDNSQVEPFGEVFCTYSDDGGATWSPLAPAGRLYGSFVQPFFFRDGSLAIVYERANPNPSVLYLDECVLSKDGGGTFGESALVMRLTGLNYHDNAVFAYSDPSACSDRQAGVLYMTVAALQGPRTNQVPRILFTRSIDHGQTWTQPIPVNDTPTGTSVFQPTIAASPDGQHVTIAFYDKRNSTGHNYLADYYLAESFDGGDTWEANVRLSEFTIDLRKSPSVGDGVWLGDYQGLVPALNFDTPAVAAWIDTRAGNNDPYVVRIQRTKGTTFDTWRKLRFSTNDFANAAISGPNADADGDSILNLAEYAFGLEPTHTDTIPLEISGDIGSPTPTVVVSYERLAVLSDIQFSWQASENLADWTAVSSEQDKITTGGDPSMQHVETSFAANDRVRFLRLRIVKDE